MFYTYKIFEEYEIDWGIYGGSEALLCSEEKISEDEWKEIVSSAFYKVLEMERSPGVEDIEKFILKHDERFKKVSSLFERVATSEFRDSLYYTEEKMDECKDWLRSELDDDGDGYYLNP